MHDDSLKHKISHPWQKAAVIGGLWASFEIIVGSFLHNLHIPFSGSFLTAFSIMLMSGFLQIWPEKGLLWRAGLICALMKSLSPSAVILGPMTGILMEALFMEFFIYLFGLRLAGLMVAGAFAMLSAILHKIGNLLLIYGSDTVRIYMNFFDFIQKQTRLQGLGAMELFYILIAAYLLVGILAAMAGTWIGKRTVPETAAVPESTGAISNSWDFVDPTQKFTPPLLVLHLLWIPFQMVLINRYGLHPAVLGFSALYLTFGLLYYKKIKHRLIKPFFWVQLLLVILFAALFWDEPGQKYSSTVQGLWVGLEMALRATLVVTAFSALSVELRNPQFKKQLFRWGFREPYLAVSLAFNALPVILERSPGGRAFFKHPFRSISGLLHQAERWLYSFQQKTQNEV